MTLIEVINRLGLQDNEIDIVYKTYAPTWDKKTMDIFNGYCRWDGEFLIALDDDCYDIEDTVDKYEFKDGKLIVWYHSQYWDKETEQWVNYPFPGEEE